MALLQANLQNYSGDANYDVLPPGDYRVMVADSEVVENSKRNPMLKITFEVVEGDHAKRKVFDNFVLNHEVGLNRLKALAIAAGHQNPNYINDSEELHGRELVVRLKVTKGEKGEMNNVTSYKPVAGSYPGAAVPGPGAQAWNGAPAATPAPAAAASTPATGAYVPPAAAAGGQKRPWER